jgi:hypothetical protein
MSNTLYGREARESGEPKVKNEECPLCAPAPAPSGRMSDTAFQSALDNDDEYAIAMEARRAREGEEIEARRANGAELLVDAREAEIAALKAENTRLREIGKEYLICGVESANKHYELVQVPRSLIADARAALGGGA